MSSLSKSWDYITFNPFKALNFFPDSLRSKIFNSTGFVTCLRYLLFLSRDIKDPGEPRKANFPATATNFDKSIKKVSLRKCNLCENLLKNPLSFENLVLTRFGSSSKETKRKKRKTGVSADSRFKTKKTSRPAHWLRSRFSHSWPGFDSQCSQDFYRPSI